MVLQSRQTPPFDLQSNMTLVADSPNDQTNQSVWRNLLTDAMLAQAVESLQELSNLSSDQVFNSSLRQGPVSIRIHRDALLSSASTLSPRTPTQSHSSDVKRCVNCQCTSTPLWRKDKSSGLMYCNACGIYFKNHGKHRPIELIEGPSQTRLQQPLSGARIRLIVSEAFMSAL